MNIYVGGDASKGYADWCCLDESGKTLREMKADDTSHGHDKLEQMVESMAGLAPTRIVVGLESSGGVERNWLGRLRLIEGLRADLNLRVVHLNPLLVHKHREHKLHSSVSDASSARTIADLLRYLDWDRYRAKLELDEAKRLEQHIAGLVEHKGRLQTELQGTLVNSHPELVQYCRSGIPAWLLTLLGRYPTMAGLADASLPALTAIPYLTPSRAHEIQSATRRTVASATGGLTATLIQSLVDGIRRLTDQIERLENQLHAFLGQDRTMEILRSLPGFGPKVSAVLRLAYGDFSGFNSEAAVVAYAGLDPRIHQSGDMERHIGISRRGKSRVRALLYLAALSAIRDSGRFAQFYNRLRSQGKPSRLAMVAVMAKMLRVAYACVLKGQLYDPAYQQPCVSPPVAESLKGSPTCLKAPVSRREAQKRKRTAAVHKCEVEPQGGQLLPGLSLTSPPPVHNAPERSDNKACHPAIA